ncbi:MAG: PAS domain S-box protein [Candidatus Aminicenantes bacterium]|nr:PAS domain S-box protein [Candidatus Aminicenantes bacterium]
MTGQKNKNGKINETRSSSTDSPGDKKIEKLFRVQRDLAIALSTEVSFDDGLKLCLDAALEASEMDCGGIYLVDENSGAIDMAYHKGLPAAFIEATGHYDADADHAKLVMAGKPVYGQFEKIDITLTERERIEHLYAIAVLPISYKDKILGCMNVASHSLDDVPVFSRNALETITAQIGGAIVNLRIEEELRESEKKFSNAFRSGASLMAISFLDSGEFIDVNEMFLQTLGYEKSEVIGKSSAELDFYVDYSRKEAIVQSVREKDFVKNFEIAVRTKKGEIREGLYSAGVFEYRGRECLLTIMNDVTDQKRAEADLQKAHDRLELRVQERTAELKKARDQLETANKGLESFNYSVSHDLRAPLRAIDGFSKALLEDYYDKLDDEGKDYLDRICNGAQRMGTLIDDMLRLSRITTYEMDSREIDMSALVRKIAAEFQAAQPKRNIEFITADNIRARGDRHLITIVLQNLLSNAVKFTAQKEKARIEFGVKDMEGTREFFVKDNGAGFKMEYKDKLFNPFQRLHSSKEFPGSGIGLSIAERIILKHNGRIRAEGEKDKGAIFYFSL